MVDEEYPDRPEYKSSEPLPKTGVVGGLTGPGGAYTREEGGDAEPPAPAQFPVEEPLPLPVEPEQPVEEEEKKEKKEKKEKNKQGRPWDSMTFHAEIDDYVKERDLSKPSDWLGKTLAQKKEWLEEHL